MGYREEVRERVENTR